ncbi:hypothetical protein AMR41_28425 [Hapalosiphon sp. MRB220]|nr:hypothetical protein AMR41_28425 [Hapalosiphon sp. MRB220]
MFAAFNELKKDIESHRSAHLVLQIQYNVLQAECDRSDWQSEIREIWRYLRYEPRNGNGRSEE